MRYIALALVTGLIFFPNESFSSVDSIASWEKVTFESGRFRITVDTNSEHFVSKLQISVSGKLVKIPKADFQQIKNPQLEKITITDSSGSRGADVCIDIPVLADPKVEYGSFTDGGSWTMCFTNAHYNGMNPPDVN